MRIPSKILIGAAAVALGGCTYGDVGLGLGYGGGYGGYYGDYGYGYGPYGGYGAYPGYYGGFGSPFGWYGDYYYPGTGIYVYDSYRRPRMWTNRERSYWTNRQRAVTSTTTTTSGVRNTTPTARDRTTSENWSAFNRSPRHNNRH